MNFNIYNILIIAGIIQGFLFTGIVYFSKKYHAKSTFFLVALIFLYSIGNLMYILPDIGAMSLPDMYGYVFLPIACIDAPIMYFYVVLFLNPQKKIVLTEKLLFLPFIIFLIVVFFFRIRLILGYDLIYPINLVYKFTVLFHELFSVAFTIAILIYLLIQISKYEKKQNHLDKTIIKSNINWLKITLTIILTFTLLWGYLAIRNIFFTQGETVFYSLWIAMAVMIYGLGHIGIYKYGVLSEREKIRNYLNKNETQSLKSRSKNPHIKDFENFIAKDKAYLDSTLTLESVAENLQISSSYLSRIIHNDLDTSFTDYLHSFRIKEAKTYLSNPDFSNYTIVSIGLEAGFNSRSAFFDVFKKETGKTPLQYKKGLLNTR